MNTVYPLLITPLAPDVVVSAVIFCVLCVGPGTPEVVAVVVVVVEVVVVVAVGVVVTGGTGVDAAAVCATGTVMLLMRNSMQLQQRTPIQ